MAIVHYRASLPAQLQGEIGRLFGASQGGSASGQWSPRVDIHEEAGRFVILADIPGVDPQSIEIQMDKGVLSLKGERTAEGFAEGVQQTRSERVHGGFERRFALPDSADADAITASGRHGVLRIDIPKRADVAPRRIQVQ